MSEQNIEIIRHAFQQINEHGLTASFAELYHEDAVMHGPQDWPETGPWRGRSAILDQWRRNEEDFGEQEMLVEEIVAHEDWVLVRSVWRVRSRSGVPGEFRTSFAARMRDGKVVDGRFFWEHAEALKAIGLSE